MLINDNDTAIRNILARVELLDEEGSDFVWGEAHAQFKADKADNRRTNVVSYFENALEMLEAHRAAGATLRGPR